jgi:hypothetical protein
MAIFSPLSHWWPRRMKGGIALAIDHIIDKGSTALPKDINEI